MSSPRYKSAKNYTQSSFLEIDECFCGKKAFKYNDTSRNIFIAKCSMYSHDFDLKSKKWSKSKKQPCGFFCIYHGPRPVFKEIVNIIKTVSVEKQVSPNEALEERLKLFFKFLFVSNHTSTLDEINLLVQNNLKRKPRIIYYYPTTTSFMKESHRESFIDYQTRIFSEKIIDRSIPIKITPVKIQISQFVADPENDSDIESETGLSEELNSDFDENEELEETESVSDIESNIDSVVAEEDFEDIDECDYTDD
jgi:hypothetical protein